MEEIGAIKGTKGVGRADRQDKQVDKHVYRVKTKGYTKQFSSYAAALKAFTKLQRDAEKEQEAYTVVLSKKDGRNWEELDKAQVTKAFYE